MYSIEIADLIRKMKNIVKDNELKATIDSRSAGKGKIRVAFYKTYNITDELVEKVKHIFDINFSNKIEFLRYGDRENILIYKILVQKDGIELEIDELEKQLKILKDKKEQAQRDKILQDKKNKLLEEIEKVQKEIEEIDNN